MVLLARVVGRRNSLCCSAAHTADLSGEVAYDEVLGCEHSIDNFKKAHNILHFGNVHVELQRAENDAWHTGTAHVPHAPPRIGHVSPWKRGRWTGCGHDLISAKVVEGNGCVVLLMSTLVTRNNAGGPWTSLQTRNHRAPVCHADDPGCVVHRPEKRIPFTPTSVDSDSWNPPFAYIDAAPASGSHVVVADEDPGPHSGVMPEEEGLIPMKRPQMWVDAGSAAGAELREGHLQAPVKEHTIQIEDLHTQLPAITKHVCVGSATCFAFSRGISRHLTKFDQIVTLGPPRGHRWGGQSRDSRGHRRSYHQGPLAGTRHATRFRLIRLIG